MIRRIHDAHSAANGARCDRTIPPVASVAGREAARWGGFCMSGPGLQGFRYSVFP
jgi:hypothetical protein